MNTDFFIDIKNFLRESGNIGKTSSITWEHNPVSAVSCEFGPIY